ncbi:histidine phosphatase family protein [bacterium]|nr:histidine phosphatase family protein [bacterium]
MLTTIYLIRHGECEGNREGLFRGRFNYPLNEQGIEQARSLATELMNVPLDAVYTSPLTRAYQTAEIVCQGRSIAPIIEEGFNNIYLGAWEGKPKSEVEKEQPHEFRLWRTEPEKLRMEGAETLDLVQKRAVSSLIRITGERRGGGFAVVTHRAVLKPLIAGLLGIPEPYFWKLTPETASYSIVEHTDERGFSLVLFNQTRHLKAFIREDV